MKILKRGFELSPHEYYKTHIQILQAVTPFSLTPKETDIIAAALTLTKGLPAITETVKKELNLGNQTSSYFKALVSKQALDPNFNIHPALIPDQPSQGYALKIILNENRIEH